ncbi:putative alpha-1,6-mannosyltransferase mnn11 [Neofusicoccum ribis]|uniref:Alpha-1,6-mannosyltransferase mnn11 n=1 Tax=Neofusicoccum ribis TaxID=45134 RepID=A0ABR3T7T5_9PEZI
MLPPIDPAALERNPKFKVLYEDLSKNKLNEDASTRDIKRQPNTTSSLISDLPAIAQDQQDELAAATFALGEQRTRLADLAASVLEAQAQLMEVVVRMLEQTVHGSVARAVRAKAEHLAAVAKGLELKLSILTLTSNPPSSLASALSNYSEYLTSEKAELQHRKAIAEDRLRAFEEAGGNGRSGIMKEIARRYAEVEEEIAKVQLEVGRLEG